MDKSSKRSGSRPGSYGASDEALLGRAQALLLLLLTGAAVLFAALPRTPAVVDSSARLDRFSADRAFRHIEALSAEPRITGSPQLKRAEDYLISQLQEMGLDSHIQEQPAAHRRQDKILAASVRNVVGRLSGKDRGLAVVLTAHYDSVPTGPGAADDAAGVATLLETARVLKNGPMLRNDVVFLFTDAEEPCLCGARAFVDSHPWADDTAVVLNFEARGNRGAAMMYETAGRNSSMINALARSSRQVVASSVASFFYGLSGSDTDLSVFRSAGVPGLNFAFLGGIPAYHTRIDSPAELDRGSLQHLGSYSVPLARRLADAELGGIASGAEAVYFSAFGLLFGYPEEWRFAVLALAFLGFAAAVVVTRRSGSRWPGVAKGALFVPLAAFAATATVAASWAALRALHPAADPLVFEYRAGIFWSATAALATAVSLPVLRWVSREVEPQEVLLGSLAWWLVLAAASTFVFTAGSYLFAWPALFLSTALALSAGLGAGSWQARAVLGAGSLASVLVYAPALYGVTVALGLFLVAVLPGVLVLVLTILIPHLAPAMEHFPRLIPFVALALAAGLFVTGAATSRFDERRPKVEGLFYIVNQDLNEAVMATTSPSAARWMSPAVVDGRRGSLARLLDDPGVEPLIHGRAAVHSLPAPSAEAVEGNVREPGQLSFRVSVPAEAARFTIAAHGGDRIVGLAVDGTPIAIGRLGGVRPASRLEYSGPPAEPLTVTVATDDPSAVRLTVMAAIPSLPEGSPMAPASRMPGQGERFVDGWSYVVRTFPSG